MHAAHPDSKYIDEIARVCSAISTRRRSRRCKPGRVPLVLGGDHSLGAGSVAAAAALGAQQHALPIGLLWIDAHGDMNTPATSPSGNVHGMPLAALLGPEPPSSSSIGGFSPEGAARAHRARSASAISTSARRSSCATSGVHVFTMKDIDRQGIATVAEQAVALAANGTAGIHVSFDMDVCDPSIAPGVGTPVKGGLDYREAHMVMEIVADSGRLTSLDLVEVNPTLDVRNATAQLGTELALSALGHEDSVGSRPRSKLAVPSPTW